MSVLGIDSGYTVKYNPLPSGTPSGKGLYLTVYPSSRPNMDTVGSRLNQKPKKSERKKERKKNKKIVKVCQY